MHYRCGNHKSILEGHFGFEAKIRSICRHGDHGAMPNSYPNALIHDSLMSRLDCALKNRESNWIPAQRFVKTHMPPLISI